MATLIPNIPIESIKHRSERDVIKALLDSLPNQCVIFHGLETLNHKPREAKAKTEAYREGEVDIILFWPGKGLLVMEVKGGQEIVCRNNQWCSKNRYGQWKDIDDPFEQARGNMHDAINIIKQYCELKSKTEVNFPYGYAAVFPDARFESEGVPNSEDLPTNAQPNIVCDSAKMKHINSFVETALEAFGEKQSSATTKVEDKQNVKNALSPALNLVPCLSSQLKNNAVGFQTLTGFQTDIVDGIELAKLASVPGVAGSGKTFVASMLARRHASKGKRTLMLCYNKALAFWLSEHMKQTSEHHIDAYSFHDFCEKVTKEAGFPYEEPTTGDISSFFENESPELLMEHAGRGNGMYDAIIVDEGQDFRALWWIAIQGCLTEGGQLAVFHDNDQDVFTASGLKELEPLNPTIYPLKRNCRNTRAIANFCYEYSGIEARVSDDAPYGEEPVIKVETDKSLMRSMVLNQLRDWLDADLAASNIVVISPFKLENSCLEKTENSLGVSLVTDIDEWRDNQGILVTTARSFKGLEADIVLLVDAKQPGSHKVFTRADFYVACSRARNVLHIMASEKLTPIVHTDQAA